MYQKTPLVKTNFLEVKIMGTQASQLLALQRKLTLILLCFAGTLVAQNSDLDDKASSYSAILPSTNTPSNVKQIQDAFSLFKLTKEIALKRYPVVEDLREALNNGAVRISFCGSDYEVEGEVELGSIYGQIVAKVTLREYGEKVRYIFADISALDLEDPKNNEKNL